MVKETWQTGRIKCRHADAYKAIHPPTCGCEACKTKWESRSKTLTGALHNSTNPPGSKLYLCKHGKRLNACSACYQTQLKKKGLST